MTIRLTDEDEEYSENQFEIKITYEESKLVNTTKIQEPDSNTNTDSTSTSTSNSNSNLT